MSHTSSATIPPVADLPVSIPTQRTAADQTPTAGEVQACRCGHGADSHQHFRTGSDCSACACGRYRTTTGLAATLRALLHRTEG